jgi:hypothetical protein
MRARRGRGIRQGAWFVSSWLMIAGCGGGSGVPPDAADLDARSVDASIDDCASASCDPDATCTDTPAGHTCTCDVGYEGDGMTCSDVDECATAARCASWSRCENRPGSYACLGEPARCLDGVDDHATSTEITNVSDLTTATIELWFRSLDATAERNLVEFRTAVASDARRVGIAITDASAQGFGSLSGRVLALTVDARDHGGALNARGFDLDASLPTFDETTWHHYRRTHGGESASVRRWRRADHRTAT